MNTDDTWRKGGTEEEKEEKQQKRTIEINNNNNNIDNINKNNIKKLRENIKSLPTFTSDFFLELSNTTSIYTRIGYSYDLKLFFEYLIKEEPTFYKDSIKEFTFNDFKKIETRHIREFLEYLSYYTREFETTNGHQKTLEETNGLRGKSRKLSSIRSLFLFFIRDQKIKHNPAALVQTPKQHEKNIISLDVNEVADLLDEIDSGDKLTDKQKSYHQKTKKRDIALVMLILGTGIRISECVSIDIKKIDFNNSCVSILRKGGKESRVYFNEEIEEVLINYIEQRKIDYYDKYYKDGMSQEKFELDFLNEPLFISLQNKRISVRTVQNLVKKYSQIATPLKNISPHKLRSTYATNLYRETNDIFLVADALGHADVNTTKKHYARMDEEQRRKAAKYVNLRWLIIFYTINTK